MHFCCYGIFPTLMSLRANGLMIQTVWTPLYYCPRTSSSDCLKAYSGIVSSSLHSFWLLTACSILPNTLSQHFYSGFNASPKILGVNTLYRYCRSFWHLLHVHVQQKAREGPEKEATSIILQSKPTVHLEFVVVTPSCSDHKKDYLAVTHWLVGLSTLMAAKQILGISNAMLRLALFPGTTCQIYCKETVAKRLAIHMHTGTDKLQATKIEFTVEI